MLKVVFRAVRSLYMTTPEKSFEHLEVVVFVDRFFEIVGSDVTLGRNRAPYLNFLAVKRHFHTF